MKIAFDIGANLGNCTVWFLGQGYDRVICAEPGTNTFVELKRRFDFDDRIVLLPVALSNNIGEIDFYEASAHTVSTADTEWISASRFAGQYTWTPVKKNATNLTQLIDTYGIPLFIKIDVEGYELQVIKGLHKKINCTIGFEWAEEKWPDVKATVAYLQGLGYTEYAFTYADSLNDTLTLTYGPWETCYIHTDINPARKDKWGMIYVK